jgi:glycosyltransferase involved in cell wall biosynthesis
VPVSHWLNELVKQSHLKAVSTEVIHNGINTSLFKPSNQDDLIKRYKLHDKFIVLGIASNWKLPKGLADFIKLRDLLDHESVIVLVGLTKKEIQKLPSGIIGIERISSIEELSELYTSSGIYANLTYEDTFPSTNLEAMSCGTPVVTYMTGGCNESVTSSTGFAVKQGDLKGIASAIQEVQQKGKGAYREQCRSHILENFGEKNQYKKYFELYSKIAP